MPVKTVLRDVQLSTQEPLHVWRFELPFKGFIPFPFPVEGLGLFVPETFGVIYCFLVLLVVFLKGIYLLDHLDFFVRVSNIENAPTLAGRGIGTNRFTQLLTHKHHTPKQEIQSSWYLLHNNHHHYIAHHHQIGNRHRSDRPH